MRIVSPTFFSETVIGQQWGAQWFRMQGDNQTNYSTQWGLPNNFGRIGMPGIACYGGLFQIFYGTQTLYGTTQIISNLDENLTKTLGRHQMQFGFRYRHEQFHQLPSRAQDYNAYTGYVTGQEQASSGANYSLTPNTGNANADFFLGAMSQYATYLLPPYFHLHDQEFDGYFQDNFHMTRNLTLNLGLRWEAHPGAAVSENVNNTFDLKNDAMVFQEPMSYYVSKGLTTQAIVTNLTNIGMKFETPVQAGMNSKLFNDYDAIIDPRVAVAWQPFGAKLGTVLRGAYGRYSYPIPVRSWFGNLGLENVPFQAIYSQNYNSGPQTDGLPNYQVRTPQTVFQGVNSANIVNSTTTTALLPGQALWDAPPDSPPDLVTQVNATLEQPMKGNSAIRLSWVWAHGANLDKTYYYNSHPSNYVWEMDYGIVPPTGGTSVIGTPQQNTYASTATGPYDQTTYGNNSWDIKNGWSNDNALQATYQRLFHQGIAYQVSYVWSRPFRVGGNGSRDSVVNTRANYQGVLGSVGTMTSPFGTVVAPNMPPAAPAGTPVWADSTISASSKHTSSTVRFPSSTSPLTASWTCHSAAERSSWATPTGSSTS